MLPQNKQLLEPLVKPSFSSSLAENSNNQSAFSHPDFFKSYLDYAGVGTSEPPANYHRWCCIGMIGALLGRQVHMPFGHGKIFPNQYIMLMGAPGTRKSTAINISKKLLSATGFSRFAADKTSKERFLMDMRQYEDTGIMDEADLLALTLDEPAETFVVAEEFTDFVGNNNMEFITMLTKLWDCPQEYKQPKIQGTSVTVIEPTVNILSGNTVQGFALAFPPEALGNGFLSRLLFIHGEPTGRKVTFPKVPDPLVVSMLAEHLKEMKRIVKGEVTLGHDVEALCDRIYKEYVDLDDARFKHYGSRRFTHLLKLCIIIAATELTTVISVAHVLKANTLLAYAERRMPKALGEFGKSKYSDVSNKILDYLASVTKPATVNELWKVVDKDLQKMPELAEIITNLRTSDKIQVVTLGGKQGLMLRHVVKEEWNSELLLPEWLTPDELV